MNSICILTDSSAQYPQLGFAGRNNVRVMPFDIELNGILYKEGQDLRTNDLPISASEELHPRLIAPSMAAFQELFLSLNSHYRDIIVILTSASLNPAFDNAKAAAKAVLGQAGVVVIDSQTTSVGLGLLVQTAAEAVAQGKPAAEVERIVRSLIPRTYMAICTPGLSWMYHAGFVDQPQAYVGEMLGLMPIFTLEEGQISAVEKVRNARGLVDFLQEFVCEFDYLHHIAFIQSVPPLSHEARMMREHAQSCFPHTPFSEHNINLPLATLVGPRSIGLVVVEKVDQPRMR